MPVIYHWDTPQTVDQDRYNYLIQRYGWYAKPTAPTKDKNISAVRRQVGFNVPDNWGQYWFPALRAAMEKKSRAEYAWLGSSTMFGYYSDDLEVTSAFAIVRDALQAAGNKGGSGFRGMTYSDTFLAGAPAGAYNRYKAQGNAWTQVVGSGSITTPTYDAGPCGRIDIAGGAYIEDYFYGKYLDVWFFNSHGSSPFTVSVDGGDPVTVTPGPGLGADIRITRYPIASNLDPNTRHKIRVTGGTNAVRYIGHDSENDFGVVANQYAIPGMQSDRYSNNNIFDSFESGTYMGGHRFRNRYNNDTEETPSLVVIAVPPNDAIKASQSYTNVGTTSGSATVTGSAFRRSDRGRTITGTGIPAGTTIDAVSEANNATLSQQATATATITATVTNPEVVSRFMRNWEGWFAGVLDNVYGGGTGVQGQTDVLIVDNLMKISSDTVKPAWREIEARAVGMAAVYGAAYVNVGATLSNSWSRFYNLGYMGNGNDPTTSGNDDIHMSKLGQEYMAKQILKVLLP